MYMEISDDRYEANDRGFTAFNRENKEINKKRDKSWMTEAQGKKFPKNFFMVILCKYSIVHLEYIFFLSESLKTNRRLIIFTLLMK